MIQELKDAADALAVAAPDVATGNGKALEALVLFTLALDLKDSSDSVEARDHTGAPLSGKFILRGSPGHLADPSAKGPKPSYFVVELHGQELELHNSLEFLGASGVEHEMDVSAVWRTDAEAARARSPRMISGPPLVGVELKDFDAETKLAKNIVRAFFGCVVDLSPTWAVRWMSVGRAGFERDFFCDPKPSRQFWIMTSALFTEPSRIFAGEYDLNLVERLNQTELEEAVHTMGARLHALVVLAPRPEPTPPVPRVKPIKLIKLRRQSGLR